MRCLTLKLFAKRRLFILIAPLYVLFKCRRSSMESGFGF